jgi:uncharacterized membrane protein
LAKLTIAFGVLLGLIGARYFVATGNAHPTALIPLWFGCALIICGVLANTENARRRMLWMHIAVTIALFGFLFPDSWRSRNGSRPAAVRSPILRPCRSRP